MKRFVCLIALLGGCVSTTPPFTRPKSLEDEAAALLKAHVALSAKPTIDRATAPVLTPDVAAGQKIVRVKLAMCTDSAGRFSSSAVKVSSGSGRFDRAVQAWIAKASFTPALNIDREPIATCDSKLDLIWQRDADEDEPGVPAARPVNPLVLPEYPMAALRRREVGTSEALICIDAQGRVTDIQESVSPTPTLGSAFDAWLRATPFKPVSRDGAPAAACGLDFGVNWALP